MAIIEVKWIRSDNNYDRLTEEEKTRLNQLGVKKWIDSPTGEVNAPVHEFIAGMEYLIKLHKKYMKEAKV